MVTLGVNAVPGAGRARAWDPALLRASFARLEPVSQKLMANFFASLFVAAPHLRGMFPLAMDAHRDRVFAALARYARSGERPEEVAQWLSELALDHRKYGVSEHHYLPFCDVLLSAIRAQCGPDWNSELEAAWGAALDYIRAVMTDAARGAKDDPPWWLAEVREHDLRRPDLAVIALAADGNRLPPYRPGQHVSVMLPRSPRVWREYSLANAHPLDARLRLHVRAVPGGLVSSALVHQTRVGDQVLIGRARGAMTVDALTSGALLCVAGGTGLAPVKAIVEAMASADRPRRRPDIRVLVGARTPDDLYDLADMRELERLCPHLELVPVVSHDPGYPGHRGALPEVVAHHLPAGPCDVVISGPEAMVAATAAVVASRAPQAHIHADLPIPAHAS